MARSSIDVMLRLHGQRKFAKELAASGTQLEAMGLKGAKAMSAFAASGEKLKNFGRSWTRNVSLPVVGLGFVAGKMAIDFSDAMNAVQTQAGASAAEVAHMRTKVLEFAKSGKSDSGPTELANALFRIESAGLRGAKAMDALRQSEALSTVGRTDIELTAQALAGAVKTGIKGAQDMNEAVGVLNATVGAGNMRFNDLLGALGTGILPSAKAAGLSLKDVGAALATMTAQNVPAQAAATRMRMAFSQLVAPTNKAKDALKELNLGPMEIAKTMQGGGLLPALDLLHSKLATLSKVNQGRVVSEIFGGGRTSSGITLLLGSLDDLNERYSLITDKAKGFNKSVESLNEEPGVKLKQAWSKVQAILIELGDEIVPGAVNQIGHLANGIVTVAGAFAGLPGPIQAATLGFLVLTGPVASGLGYFASGIGKALVLTRKLAMAGEALSISSTAMSAGQGLGGSAAIAFQGTGMAAALQTAKGFAYSLGPAVAAYGIGNIVTSAVNKDWTDAGAEAGGAILGGIAGFVLTGGSPFGAMLGTGLGSMAGEKLAQAFGAKTASPLVKKLAEGSKETTYWFGEQRKASKALIGAESSLSNAHNRQHEAIARVKGAQAHLTAMIQQYGPDTRPVIRAEAALAQKRWGVAKATQAIHDKEKLRGIALAGAKASARWAIGSEKEQIHLLSLRAKRLGHLLHYEQFHGASRERLGEIGKRIGNVLGSLHEEERKLKITGGNAAKQIGEKWANNMMHMSSAMLKFETRPFETKLDHLGNNPGPKKLAQGFKEMSKQTSGLLRNFSKLVERANKKTEELESRRLPDFSLPGFPLHPETAGPPRPHPRPHHKGSRQRTAQSLTLPAPQRVRLTSGGLSQVVQIHVVNQNTLHLDGKEIAANTTRHSQRAANRG